MGEVNETVKLILTLSISGGLFALALFALKPFMRNRLSKSFQYYIWIVVLLRFMLPFSFGVNLMDFTFNAPNESQTVEETTLPNNNPINPANINPAITDHTVNNNEPDISERQPSKPITADGAEPLNILKTLADNLLWIWLAGMLVSLAFNILGYWLFMWYIHGAAVAAPIPDCGAKIFKSRFAPTPMLVGVIRPRIYLPDIEYTDGQLHNILLHELTHLRRRDVWLKWFATLCVSAHWFNPIAYFMRREINRACEMSCDEAVIRDLDGAAKQSYGDTLISVVAESRYPVGVMSTTMCEEKKKLKERLVAIMNYKKKTKIAVLITAVLAVVITGSAFAFGASFVSPQQSLNASEALQQLKLSVVPSLVDISFEIPANYTPSTDWNIFVTGRAEFEDGFSMSVHLFEEENEAHAWEPGKRYYIDTLDKKYTELMLLAYLPQRGGEPLEVEVDLLAAASDGMSAQQHETLYSPDGKYYVETYGVNTSITAGGLFPAEGIRVVKTESGEIMWLMEPGYYEQHFIWSPDSRYVSVYYMARTWGGALVVDTIDMTEHPLPGLGDLTPYFPEAIPDENRPDPYVIPQYWMDDHTIFVECKWISDYAKSETNEFFCRYAYDVSDNSLADIFEGALGSQSSPIKLADVPGVQTYEVRASVHESLPEYRFLALGLTENANEWWPGYIIGFEVYDEKNVLILSADFSRADDGKLTGNYVYNQMMDTMGLHVVDVNFDGYKDVIILKDFGGAHSNTWYDCWMWDVNTSSFIYSKSFAEICNPALDAENERIYSAGGSGAAYWGGRIYKFANGEFVLTNELDTDMYGLVERELVNGEMRVVREVSFGEGDQIIKAEQEYYKNNELWQLDNPRWYWYGGHHADQWLGG